MDEKTTDRTMRAWTDWSQSEGQGQAAVNRHTQTDRTGPDRTGSESLLCSFTTFTGSSTQPGVGGVVVETVVPEVGDLRVGPHPPGLQTVTPTVRKQETLQVVVQACPTFSRVEMRSMAKVTR